MATAVRRFAASCILVLLAASFAAAQGITWESETTVSGQIEKQRYHYMPGMFKTVSEDNREMIMRMDKGMIYSVDRGKKEYWEMTFEELEGVMKKLQGTMDARMAEMRKQMAGMPEEQRKMVEQMMGGAMGGKDEPISVKKTGETKTISSYPCTKYVVTQGKRDVVTMWTTRDVKEFQEMAKEWQEFGKRMAQLTPTVGKAMAEGISQVEGFPVRVETGAMTSVVKTVRKSVTPAAEFTVPAGYKKVQPEFLEEMQKEKGDPGQ